MAAHWSANNSRKAKSRAKKREEKKREEEEKKLQEEADFKREECSDFPELYKGPDPNEDKRKREARWKRIKKNIKEEEDFKREVSSEFPQFYERPDPNEDNKKQGERRRLVRKNMKAERRALKVERDLKEECVNLQRPDLYHERPSGEISKQQKARRLKIRRGLEAATAASNEMVVDQVVEEAMGQPGQFEGTLNHPNRSNPPPDQGVEECLNGRQVYNKVVNEWQVYNMVVPRLLKYLLLRYGDYYQGYSGCWIICHGDPFHGQFYGDTYQIKGKTSLVHENNIVEFGEDDDGKWKVGIDYYAQNIEKNFPIAGITDAANDAVR